MPSVSNRTIGRIVLITGATGYIGGRLVPKLIAEGHRVRVLVRDRRRIAARPWSSQVEIVVGDAADGDDLTSALTGVDTAYYLIHSMSSGAGFGDLDMRMASTFGRTAGALGVRRLIYLGGLGDPGSDLSPHLRSRQQTGQALRAGGVPVTEFRAAIIIGAGSVSFEMIRNLVERLPVMICPQWIYSRVQPIAVGDVLAYLVAALGQERCQDRTVEIGGGTVTTYRGLMLAYARARGLRRLLLPVPVL
ncbi:MAG: NAD(P)H-binding protein, partial [Chloroflexota bacterium]|nr:NAD(P)H-binding protein [Chloroflexota bacterium]